MKLMITLAFSLLHLFVSAQQAGRVRLSFVGFDCRRETWDDALQLDGKCDEVFLYFNINLASRDGVSKLLNYELTTPTYGDNHGTFTNRVNAGSCVDLFGNLRGGIKAGDSYRGNFLLGEYNLDAGDVVTVIPTIWEWDPGQDILTTLVSGIKNTTQAMNQRIVSVVNSITPAPGNLSAFILDGNAFGLPTSENIIQAILGKQGTRPIGMTQTGSFVPKVVAFTTSFLQMATTSNFGFGTGIIPVTYNEELLGNSRDHGHYVILLRAEWTPATTTATAVATPIMGTMTTIQPAPATMQAVTTTTTNNTVVPAPAPAGNSATVSIAGNWNGSYTPAGNNAGNAMLMQFFADGSVEVTGLTRGQPARGTYTLNGNQFSARVNASGGTTYVFTGTLVTNQLSGNFTASSKQTTTSGRWAVQRQ
jgi:hypothetical protein